MMKTIQTLLLCGILLCSTMCNSQDTQSIANHVNNELRLQEIEQSIALLEKERSKTVKAIQSNQLNLNDLERDLDTNISNTENTNAEKKEVHDSMNGLVLSTLKTKVHNLQKTKAKNERTLSANIKSIHRKTAQIEKLSLEIEQMSSENYSLTEEIKEDAGEIDETNDIISDNNLVSKNEAYHRLEKKSKSLSRINARLNQKIGRSKEYIATENRELNQKEDALTALQRQQGALQRSGSSSVMN